MAVPARLGLDVVVPGQVYSGDRAAVRSVVDGYRLAGFYVEPTWEGYVVRRTSSGLSQGLHLLDRSSRVRNTERPRSTRLGPSHIGDEHVAAAAQVGHTTRVEEPVAGLFDRIDPAAKIADWDFYDVAHTEEGTTHLKTRISAPDGAIGILYQTYRPATRKLEMRSVYADQLPSWIAEAPALVPGKGIPTVTYLLHRQWKMLGVEYGELRSVKLSTVEEIRTLVEFAVQRQAGVPPDIAVLGTHTTQYTRTALAQSGHRITAARVALRTARPLDDVLARFESKGGVLSTRKERQQRDPEAVARNDALIADAGKGKITRTTILDVDFDVEYTLAPFHGQTVNHEP